MKTVTEILGGAQMLLPVTYDIQDVFEEYLTEEHRTFLAMLRVVEDFLPLQNREYQGRGRKPIHDIPILRAFLCKCFFNMDTNRELLNRLKSDRSLRQICGFNLVPSEATLSRRLKEFSEHHIMEQILNPMVKTYHDGHIVGHISRDSTAIPAREKPVNKKADVKPLPKRKRGRPRKGEKVPQKKTRLDQQMSMSPGKAIRELDTACSWGCKKNSQGKVSYWKGYKLHLDVTDMGIPITAVVTAANVHDSQLAIPMEKLTERKITHCYSLMDAAYDARPIRSLITLQGRVALIDQNKRRNDTRPPMDEAQTERYKIRTTVERSNAHLKDWLLPSKIMIKGHAKVNFVLLCGVVVLAAIKILQYFILPKLENAA